MVAMLLRTLKNLYILQIPYAAELALHIHMFQVCECKQQLISNLFLNVYIVADMHYVVRPMIIVFILNMYRHFSDHYFLSNSL